MKVTPKLINVWYLHWWRKKKKPSFLDGTKIRFLVIRKKLSKYCQVYQIFAHSTVFWKLKIFYFIYDIDDSHIDCEYIEKLPQAFIFFLCKVVRSLLENLKISSVELSKETIIFQSDDEPVQICCCFSFFLLPDNSAIRELWSDMIGWISSEPCIQ